MKEKYRVVLTPEEQAQLTVVVSKGQSSAPRIRHAHILLHVDENGIGGTDEQAAHAYHCHPDTVHNVRQRYVKEGLEAALGRKRREQPPCPPRLDGEGQARLTQLACSTPPEGYGRWTLQLLADHMVLLEVVESISHQTVMRTLKKTNSSLICGSNG